MRESKIVSGLVDFATAYCVGHCSIFGVSPFGIAILGAGGICGRNVWSMLLALGLAQLERTETLTVQMAEYLVIWLLTIACVRCRQFQLWRPHTFFLSLLVGAVTTVVHLAGAGFFAKPGQISIAVIEGSMVFSFQMAFAFAYKNFEEDSLGFLGDTQGLLAVLIFITTIFCGIPLRLFGVVEVLQTVCLFSIFFFLYRFGFAAGVSWAAVSGAIYAMRESEPSVLIAWVFVSMAVACLTGMLHTGRYGSLLLYSIIYIALGYGIFPVLLVEAGIKAFSSAILLLFFVPGSWMVPYAGKWLAEESYGAEWGKLMLHRMRGFSDALKRIDYTFAGTQGQEIGFRQIGTILDGFTRQLDRCVPMRKDMESAILQQLGKLGVQVKSMTLLRAENGQYQLYTDACVKRGRLVGAEAVRQIVSREMKIPFEIGQESRQMVGRTYDLLILEQKPAFELRTAARRLSCQENVISGDNFYIGHLQHGQMLVMIADGMGNGTKAAADSEALLASVEELLSSGFEQEIAVRLVNAYLAEKNKGEHFTTLDMLLFDQYTGVGHLVKYGAAATYIKRGEWMECVKSTSLPVGILESAGCECSSKKYYQNDLIVMVSDGVLDSIMFENKDDYMHTLLDGLTVEEPEEIVEAIVEEIHGVCGKRLKDDATIVVSRVVKNL